jgi:hypothetical protein
MCTKASSVDYREHKPSAPPVITAALIVAASILATHAGGNMAKQHELLSAHADILSMMQQQGV